MGKRYLSVCLTAGCPLAGQCELAAYRVACEETLMWVHVITPPAPAAGARCAWQVPLGGWPREVSGKGEGVSGKLDGEAEAEAMGVAGGQGRSGCELVSAGMALAGLLGLLVGALVATLLAGGLAR